MRGAQLLTTAREYAIRRRPRPGGSRWWRIRIEQEVFLGLTPDELGRERALWVVYGLDEPTTAALPEDREDRCFRSLGEAEASVRDLFSQG